ncbi:nucleoside-diphosphate sugar epimerases [Legionella sainthelensi]|nr:nucleoside-diphosphate sugar epimerases [Legionella sainthelensi]
MIEIVKIFLKRLYIKSPVLLNDLLAIPVAWYAAYWLRYNLQPFPERLTSTHSFYALALLTVIQVTCYFYFKTYRGLWRFFH